MKGKRLYHLLQELSNRNKQDISDMLQISNDKRAIYFSSILKKKFKSNEALDTSLNDLFASISAKDSKETDKSIRRFIDYSCKIIEDYLIAEHIKQNPSLRLKYLSKWSMQTKAEYLQEYFLSKLKNIALKLPDNSLYNEYLNAQINRYGRSQNDKHIKNIMPLLEQKKNYLNFTYHEQLSGFYRLLSTTTIDESISESWMVIPSHEELDKLADDSLNKIFAADYIITKARFAFFNPNFDELIEAAISKLDDYELKEKDRLILLRRAYFLKMVNGFNKDSDVNELLKYSEKILEVNLVMGFRDALSFFYHILFLIFSNKKDLAVEKMKEHEDFFFSAHTLFYKEFIEAIIIMKNSENDTSKGNDTALTLFSDLKYSPNYYISLWACLYEYLIYYKSGNILLCKSLIERMKAFLYQHKDMSYSYEASSYIYAVFRAELSTRKLNKQAPKLSILHKYILHLLHKA